MFLLAGMVDLRAEVISLLRTRLMPLNEVTYIVNSNCD